MIRLVTLACTATALTIVFPGQVSAQFDKSRWEFQAESATVVTQAGRQSLRLLNGIAWLSERISDGTIELDMLLTGDMGFSGILFRMQDPRNYEHVYLRSHLSGMPDATQYEPVLNGTGAWQIYTGPGFNEAVPFATKKWVHLRLDFSDTGAALYVDSDRPVQVFPRLKGPTGPGRIGVTSSIAPAYFANVRVTVRQPAITIPNIAVAPVPPGAIRNWGVSTTIAESLVANAIRLPRHLVDSLSWVGGESTERGIVNLARYRMRSASANTVLAAVELNALTATTQRLRFGFSDRVRVFLNGRLLYAGEDVFRSRDYRFLGTIGLFDQVALPLEPGPNVLVLAVSESFGGWGVVGALQPSAEQVTITPYCGPQPCPR
jgi:hypothetical protein